MTELYAFLRHGLYEVGQTDGSLNKYGVMDAKAITPAIEMAFREHGIPPQEIMCVTGDKHRVIQTAEIVTGMLGIQQHVMQELNVEGRNTHLDPDLIAQAILDLVGDPRGLLVITHGPLTSVLPAALVPNGRVMADAPYAGVHVLDTQGNYRTLRPDSRGEL